MIRHDLAETPRHFGAWQTQQRTVGPHADGGQRLAGPDGQVAMNECEWCDDLAQGVGIAHDAADAGLREQTRGGGRGGDAGGAGMGFAFEGEQLRIVKCRGALGEIGRFVLRRSPQGVSVHAEAASARVLPFVRAR